jgi:small-conductance mechanosensitive channel
MTDELTKLMNKAVDCSDERGYYRDTDKALKQIFEFYIEHRPNIAELTARRDIFRDIDLPALAEAQFTIRQLPAMMERIAQLEERLERIKQDQVTKPDLTNQTLPTAKQDQVTKPDLTNQTAKQKEINSLIQRLPDMSEPKQDDIVTKAQRVMGDSYQPPAVKLFDYGD